MEDNLVGGIYPLIDLILGLTCDDLTGTSRRHTRSLFHLVCGGVYPAVVIASDQDLNWFLYAWTLG